MIEAPLSFGKPQDAPSSWWSVRPDDPRSSLAWAIASRWNGDGVYFSGIGDSGPCLMVRKIAGHEGYSRMNLVDICGGTYRGVTNASDAINSARRQIEAQILVATTGYATRMLPAQFFVGDIEDAAKSLILALHETAESSGASFGLAHIPHSEVGLRTLLDQLGFAIGMTDFDFVLPIRGNCFEDHVSLVGSDQRVILRRDRKRLAAEGGTLEILVGPCARTLVSTAAELEAMTRQAHGDTPVPADIKANIDRVIDYFGPDMALCVVRNCEGEAVASCLLVAGESTVLVRSIGVDAERGRDIHAYFNALVSGPMEWCFSRGATRLVLGPGSATPKTGRGASAVPLYTAVPEGDRRLGELLDRTDDHMRSAYRNYQRA